MCSIVSSLSSVLVHGLATFGFVSKLANTTFGCVLVRNIKDVFKLKFSLFGENTTT